MASPRRALSKTGRRLTPPPPVCVTPERTRIKFLCVSITRSVAEEDVFDLVVNQYHNYATSAGVFIHNTVDLCRIHGTLPEPEDQISLTFAGNFLNEKIENGLLESNNKLQLTKNIVRDVKEKFGWAEGSFHNSIYTFLVDGQPGEIEVSEVISEAVTRLVQPIVHAIRKLISGFDPEFQHRLRNKIIIAGGGSRLRGIDRVIENSLKK